MAGSSFSSIGGNGNSFPSSYSKPVKINWGLRFPPFQIGFLASGTFLFISIVKDFLIIPLKNISSGTPEIQ